MRSVPSRLAGSAALFACGALACLAWRSGLFANAAVAGLAGCLVALGSLRPPPSARPAGTAAQSPGAASALALQAELRRLRALLDQAPAPFVILSADGALRAVNRAARAMFGTDDRILSPPPGLRDALARAPGERAVLPLPPRPGAEPARSYAVSVAVSAATEGVSRLAVLTDVQAEMLAAEARTLRDLLQVLGHEIMNSLTPVTSMAETARAMLAGADPADLPRVAEALETIRRRALGLDRFVQGYRTLARLPEPVLRASSVSAVLRDAAALFETRWGARGVELRLDPPSPDVVARMDPDLVGQALLNLLANGAEAALSGAGARPAVSLSGFAADGRAAFRVRDNGDGVPPGREQAIFQPFFSLKSGGTGVGLGLARQIASSHGGTLRLEPAEQGAGAAFVLSV